MIVSLKPVVGGSTGSEVSFVTPEFVIGRAPDCDLQLKDRLVSRHHCVLSIADECLRVRDTNSHNGTFVNLQRVQECELRHRDLLAVGMQIFEVRVVGSLAVASVN